MTSPLASHSPGSFLVIEAPQAAGPTGALSLRSPGGASLAVAPRSELIAGGNGPPALRRGTGELGVGEGGPRTRVFGPSMAPFQPLAPPPIEPVDLAAAVASEMRAGHARGALQAELRAGQRRALLECMRVFAGQSYCLDKNDITRIGGMEPLPELSTPAMKVWLAETALGMQIVLAFAGTRMNAADLSHDLASFRLCAHVNPLGRDLPPLADVGQGWSQRWAEQVQAGLDRPALADTLRSHAIRAQAKGLPLQVLLTGHSMGGAVATLAGYDVAHFLAQQGVPGMTSVYAFNPPRLGAQQARTGYQQALTGGGAADALPGAAAPALVLRQLTCEFDPVQSLPLGQHHPLWHPANVPAHDGARGVPGTYHAAGRDRKTLPSHMLDPWQAEIAAMSPAQLDRLFGKTET